MATEPGTDTNPEETGSPPSADEPSSVDAALWRRDEQEAPGSVTFTELLYHPLGDDDLEWLELYNPMALDMDLSDWSLSGGISYEFEAGTVVAAGGYAVVAANPALLEQETGLTGVLGPYDGQLSNGGERIELRSVSGRLIDGIGYGDDAPWPVHPDGSGLSLAKTAPTSASDRAENWSHSVELGGTPGAANQLNPLSLPTVVVLVDSGATWRYDHSGGDLLEGWTDVGFDDSGWDLGEAPFTASGAAVAVDATAWATADNYFALYLGTADGDGLRMVGEDTDGSWSTVEEVALEVTPADHLYLAAWEATGDSVSPQMTIAEVELADGGIVGTAASSFEGVLGPTDANPGILPDEAPPSTAALFSLIEDANSASAWMLPTVDASRGSSPWGSAVSSAFTDAARFIWSDTFSSDSETNAEDTYVLFRSIAPLVEPLGNTTLEGGVTTTTFRTTFTAASSPSSLQLYLDCSIDDGAVFYLNGVEVLRENMPTGIPNATTLASAEVGEATALSAEISTAPLVTGTNVLAVEVHQASEEDEDLYFDCVLSAESSSDGPAVLFNEVGPAAAPLWVELVNLSAEEQDLGGLQLVTSAGDAVVLSEAVLAPGALLALEDLGLSVENGERVFLYTADGGVLLDAVRVAAWLRGREDSGGDWRVPSTATPGEVNRIERFEDVVINEIQYHRAPRSVAGMPFMQRDEEWIELVNRGADAVDLSGWQIVDAATASIPAGTVLEPDAHLVIASDAEALRKQHPTIDVVAGLSGRLSNSSDRIQLLDAVGNLADEVRYFDGGRWPTAADGGGATLELRDPWADNATAEAWAASDEQARTAWEQVTIREVATASPVGPDGVWEELVLGLLDDGVVLIDDLSIIANPDTDPVELISSGGFDDGGASWRLLGNHRHSAVVPDPEDASNPVLRLEATGATGHMHNHAETTLAEAVREQEYEISFRARWVSGSNQLHSRLYFNRLPTTTLLAQPERSGSPGAENTTLEENLGPTMTEMRQDVVVPAPGEPVVVTISVDDPDGVAAVTLLASVDGEEAQEQAMTELENGQWSAELAGAAAGAIVQIHVEAEDSRGAVAFFPAAGADARALYTVDDGLAATNGLHSFRILMTDADADWLHEDVNLMSNDRVGATVVYNESEVFYDVGVRLKGSQRGRPTAARLGYGVRFNDDQPFRGSHTSVMIDRSEGVGFGQREVLLNLMMTRAGLPSGEHNDLIKLIAPRSEYTGAAELQLDRFSSLVLDAQFTDGASGTRFEYELVYYPSTTDDGTDEGLKRPQPDSVIGTAITDLGADPEGYRWSFLIKNNLREDRYDEIMALCQTFDLPEDDFLAQAGSVIDVEQWLQAFAFSTLSGATDQYGGAGSQHNAQLYVRPSDGRVLFFPHDMDYFSSTSMPVVNNNDLAMLLADPVNQRSYYGHLNDIISRAYSTDYLAPWCEQLAVLLPGQDIDAHCQFIDSRADWVLSSSSESVLAQFPMTAFQITTGGGEDLTVTELEVVLEGEGWVDVREVRRDGVALDLTWRDARTWQVTVPLAAGDNDIALQATDLHGDTVGSDTITVTAEVGG